MKISVNYQTMNWKHDVISIPLLVNTLITLCIVSQFYELWYLITETENKQLLVVDPIANF